MQPRSPLICRYLDAPLQVHSMFDEPPLPSKIFTRLFRLAGSLHAFAKRGDRANEKKKKNWRALSRYAAWVKIDEDDNTIEARDEPIKTTLLCWRAVQKLYPNRVHQSIIYIVFFLTR